MRRRAFTLVELIIVMGILICLMTIMLPVLVRARESGKRVQCLSNLRTLTTAWIAYAGDNERHLCGGGWAVGAPGTVQSGLFWHYIGATEPYRCPDDRTRPDIVPYSYSLNGTLAGGTYQRLDDIRTPATIFAFIEACPPPMPQPRGNLPAKPGPAPPVFTTPILPQFVLTPGGWPGQNHRGVKAAAEGTCISFADGHAIFWDYIDARIGTLEESAWAGLLGPIDGSGYSKIAAPNSPDIYQLEIWSGGPVPQGNVHDWILAAHQAAGVPD